jgi:hypothetical protein
MATTALDLCGHDECLHQLAASHYDAHTANVRGTHSNARTGNGDASAANAYATYSNATATDGDAGTADTNATAIYTRDSTNDANRAAHAYCLRARRNIGNHCG